MKTEIILQRSAVEKLIESYEALVKQINSPADREYFIGKRTAYEDLLILFRDDKYLSDLHSEAFTPSDES